MKIGGWPTLAALVTLFGASSAIPVPVDGSWTPDGVVKVLTAAAGLVVAVAKAVELVARTRRRGARVRRRTTIARPPPGQS